MQRGGAPIGGGSACHGTAGNIREGSDGYGPSLANRHSHLGARAEQRRAQALDADEAPRGAMGQADGCD